MLVGLGGAGKTRYEKGSAIIWLNTSIIRGIEWEPKSFIHSENLDIHSENFDISLETNDIDIQKIITCIQSTMISKKK